MPPKVKDGKKPPPDIVLDGVNFSKMSQEQLVLKIIEEVKNLHEAKKKRAFGEEERDLFFRKLEIKRDELKRCRAEQILKEDDMQETRNDQHAEMKVHKQRARHIRYELEEQLEKAKLEQEAFLTDQARLHDHAMNELIMKRLEMDSKHQNERRAFEHKATETAALAEVRLKNVQANYEMALADHIADFEAQKADIADLADIETRTYKALLDQQRLEHIESLKKNFEKNYHEVKTYFQELTLHNLNMIQELTKQSDVIKGHFNSLHKRFKDISKETEKSREPLKTQTQKLHDLKKQYEAYMKERHSLHRTKQSIQNMEAEKDLLLNQIKQYQDEHEKVQSDYKFLVENFSSGVAEVKKHLGTDANQAHEGARTMQQQLEQMKQALREHTQSNKDESADILLRKLEDVENRYARNLETTAKLQQTYHRMAKIYNDSLLTIRFIVEKYDLDLDVGSLKPKLLGTLAMKPTELGRIGRSNTED